jgi:hypothetical protein
MEAALCSHIIIFYDFLKIYTILICTIEKVQLNFTELSFIMEKDGTGT